MNQRLCSTKTFPFFHHHLNCNRIRRNINIFLLKLIECTTILFIKYFPKKLYFGGLCFVFMIITSTVTSIIGCRRTTTTIIIISIRYSTFILFATKPPISCWTREWRICFVNLDTTRLIFCISISKF